MAMSKAARSRAAKRRPRYKTGPKKGQFKPGKARARRNPPKRRRAPRKRSTARATTRRAPRRRAPVKRRSPRRNPGRYARNPSMKRTLDMIVETGVDAVQVVVGKAASYSVPDLFNLPSTGNVGLAVRLGVAVALGWVADEVVGGDLGENLMLGGFVGAAEDLTRQYNVPWLSNALATQGMGRYAPGTGTVGRYVQAAQGPHLALAGPRGGTAAGGSLSRNLRVMG